MSEMRQQTFLMRRGSVYYFRRKVPPELRQVIGKREVLISLRTSNEKQALPLARQHAVRTDQEFAEHRRKLAAPPPDALKEPERLPTEEEMAYIAGAMRSSAAEADRQLRIDGTGNHPGWDREAWRAAIGRALATGDPCPELEMQLEDWLINRGFLVPPADSLDYRRLAYAFAEAAAEVAGISASRSAGQLMPTPPVPALPSSMGAPAPTSGLTLRSVMEKWAKEREPAPRTLAEADTVIRQWEAVHGVALPLRAIQKRHIVDYKNAVADRTPKGRPKGTRMSAASINKQLNLLRAWLSYAESNDLVPVNVARGVSVSASKTPRERRLPFTRADYRTLFSSKVFAEGHRPLGGAGEAAFWIPIICAATGCRLGEAAQLRVEDVRQSEEGFWYLDIHDRGEGSSIKNTGSRRRVPLHPSVLALGLLAYRDSLPSAGPLFPLLKSSSKRVRSASFSQWFGRYRREVGITDPRTVLHSSRHAFKDLCRDADVSSETADRLTGHAPATVGGGYGTGPSLKTLYEAVLKLPLGDILGSIPAVQNHQSEVPASSRRRRATPTRDAEAA